MSEARKQDDYDITARQQATSEKSAAMRLDRPTEDQLYKLYRDYFRDAEDNRSWNPWQTIPWDKVKTDPAPELVATVIAAYREDLFLPDYSARALQALRASRGRAWFLTRWSYEEGKHLLVLSEWLRRSGAYTDAQLKELTDGLLTAYQWEPPYTDAPAIFVDSLLWEIREVGRAEELRRRAELSGDEALTVALDQILADEIAQREFFLTALGIIAKTYPDAVHDATERVGEALERPEAAREAWGLIQRSASYSNSVYH